MSTSIKFTCVLLWEYSIVTIWDHAESEYVCNGMEAGTLVKYSYIDKGVQSKPGVPIVELEYVWDDMYSASLLGYFTLGILYKDRYTNHEA